MVIQLKVLHTLLKKMAVFICILMVNLSTKDKFVDLKEIKVSKDLKVQLVTKDPLVRQDLKAKKVSKETKDLLVMWDQLV